MKLPRVRCRVCGRDVPLRRNRRLRQHNDVAGKLCKGSGSKHARTSLGRRAVSRRPSAKTGTPRLRRRRPISRARSRSRYRAADIAPAGSRDGDGQLIVSMRPLHYAPLLIRWPRELLSRVEDEVERRRAKAGSSWSARSIYRAAVIRELVDAQLTSLEHDAKAKAKGTRR